MNGRPPLALAYHGIGEVPVQDDPHGLFVAPERLERHIAWLREQGYRLVTFGELVARGEEGLCALTFDDGFADNEALIGMGVPATVFVVTEWLGGEHPDAPGAPMLDADGVRRLRDGGIEIGGHTASHPDLTGLGFEAARAELERGRVELEAILGAPVRSAAYPYGRATVETVRACAAAGFRAACRTSGQGSAGDPLDFPRQDMDGPASLLGLRLKAADRYEPLMRSRVAGAFRRVGRHLRRT
jgi:peptidoglycan/xylan/chitin deacetylase (PgdA/CDA1 family)